MEEIIVPLVKGGNSKSFNIPKDKAKNLQLGKYYKVLIREISN